MEDKKRRWRVDVADRYDKEWSATFYVVANSAIKAIDWVKVTINPKYVFRKTYAAEEIKNDD